MRPILVSLPSKVLFFIALAAAAVLFGRDQFRKRRDGASLTANPLLLVAAALARVRFFSPTASFVPDSQTFAQPWQPVPIYAYGVMLGTSLILGWFLAMRFARQDGIPTDDAAAIYMWTAVWSIIGSRVLYVLTNLSIFIAAPVEIIKINNGGLVAYGGMIGGLLCSIYQCRKRHIPLLQWADASAPSVVLGTDITHKNNQKNNKDFGAQTNQPKANHNPKGSPAWHRHVELYGLS